MKCRSLFTCVAFGSLLSVALPAYAVVVNIDPGPVGTSFSSKTFNLTEIVGLEADGTLTDFDFQLPESLSLQFDLEAEEDTPGVFALLFIDWDTGRGITGGTVSEPAATITSPDLTDYPNSLRSTTFHNRDFGGDRTQGGARWLFTDYPDAISFNVMNFPLTLPVSNVAKIESATMEFFINSDTGQKFTVVGDSAGLLGDLDGDDDIDFDDIPPLVLGLLDAAAYEADFGVPPTARGDIDGDGDLDFDDIPVFVDLLRGDSAEQIVQSAGAAIHQVPEPSVLTLSLVAFACLLRSRVRRR